MFTVGYHLGQFGLVKGKAFPFDFDTRVPLLVRGPGIAPNSERLQPTVNIDLAPTFLDIAGLEKPGHMDGKSLLPLLRKPHRKLRSAFLLERGKMTFERYAMVSINNEVLQQPPIEGTSLAIFRKNQLTKRERLEIECRKERYRAPCKEGQRWVCRQKKDGFTRIARCRPGEEKQAPCHCQPGEVFGWKYRTLEQSEVSMQKQFLKKHLELSNLKRLRPRFLKTLPGAEHVIQRRGEVWVISSLAAEILVTLPLVSLAERWRGCWKALPGRRLRRWTTWSRTLQRRSETFTS